MKRLDIHEYFILLAIHAAQRASCIRRKVGCVFVSKRNYVISTGYNGPASGHPNCQDKPCPAAYAPSGTRLGECRAIHAEMNAFHQAIDRLYEVERIYVTAKCCKNCTDVFIFNVANGAFPNLKAIYYLDDYPHDCHQELEDLGVNLIQIKDVVPSMSKINSIIEIYK